MRKSGLLVALGLSFAVMVAPMVLAQSVEKVPFEKRLKLASVGDEEAQLSVGLAYETGTKAKVSKVEAAKWYRKAADQGNIEAKYRLARLLQEGEGGVAKDVNAAAKLYQEAAAAGNIEAQNWLGYSYEHGLGLAVDYAKAAEWYRKAADAGLAIARNNLGLLYLNGKGLSRDYEQAFKLFDEAAKQGDMWAINNLGGMYEMGWGTKANKAIALQLYGQAATKGNPHAEDNVRRLTGTTTTKVKPVAKPDQPTSEGNAEAVAEQPPESAPVAEGLPPEEGSPAEEPVIEEKKAEAAPAPAPPPRTVKTDSSPD